jgi:hypothetical protein
MENDGLLPCSQRPQPIFNLIQITLLRTTAFGSFNIHFNLLSSYLWLGQSTGLFPSGSPTKILYATMEATGLKCMVLRSSWTEYPPYRISYKSTNWFKIC